MSTCLDIITLALKLTKVLGSGGVPSSAETSDGMTCLQSLYDGWVTGGMFGRMIDCYLTDDADAQEGHRYFVPTGITLTPATNAYVPQNGDGYSECDYASGIGHTRQPRDLAIYESLTEAGVRTVRLYDRTAWVDLLDLQSDDEAPLSKRDAAGLAACLATSGAFVAMFGGEVHPAMIVKASGFLKNIIGKEGSTEDEPAGEYL